MTDMTRAVTRVYQDAALDDHWVYEVHHPILPIAADPRGPFADWPFLTGVRSTRAEAVEGARLAIEVAATRQDQPT